MSIVTIILIIYLFISVIYHVTPFLGEKLLFLWDDGLWFSRSLGILAWLLYIFIPYIGPILSVLLPTLLFGSHGDTALECPVCPKWKQVGRQTWECSETVNIHKSVYIYIVSQYKLTKALAAKEDKLQHQLINYYFFCEKMRRRCEKMRRRSLVNISSLYSNYNHSSWTPFLKLSLIVLGYIVLCGGWELLLLVILQIWLRKKTSYKHNLKSSGIIYHIN